MGSFMKFSHLTDAIILFGDEFDNFQTKLIRVGHHLHLKLGVQVLGCRSSGEICKKNCKFHRLFLLFHQMCDQHISRNDQQNNAEQFFY